MTNLDIRQSILRSALTMIGSAANDTVDTILTKVDAETAKLYENGNIILADGGLISFNAAGTSVSFTQTLKLTINSKVAGGAPVIISLGSTSRTVSANGRMVYAVIDRVGGTAVVTDDAATLPAMIAANQEVVLIAKRVDSGDGSIRIYFRDGTSLPAGGTGRLGSAGGGVVLDSEFAIADATDTTKRINFDAAGTTGTQTTIQSSQTSSIVLTLPNLTDTLVSRTNVESLTNKRLGFSVATDSTTTGTNSDLSTTVTTGIIRLTNSALVSIGGILASTNGQELIITNATGNAIQILNNSPASNIAEYTLDFTFPIGTMDATTDSDGQTFTTTIAGSISTVQVYFQASTPFSGTNDIVMHIRATSGGLPSGPILGTSNGVSSSTISTSSPSSHTFTFSSPVPVLAGVMYAFVIDNAAVTFTSNSYQLHGPPSGNYAGGTWVTSINSGVSYTSFAGLDVYFVIAGTATRTTSDQILTGNGTLTMAANSSVTMYYDTASLRWRVIDTPVSQVLAPDFNIADKTDLTKQVLFTASGSSTGTSTTLVFAQTLNRVITFPDATTTVVGTNVTQTLTNKTFGDAITMVQIATPSNPPAGSNKLYFKSGDALYYKTSAGTEFPLSSSLSNPMTTLADIIVGGVGGTPERLGIGEDATRLVADTSQPFGIKWAYGTFAVANGPAPYAIPLLVDTVNFDTTGGAFTATLPTPVGRAGKTYEFRMQGTPAVPVPVTITTPVGGIYGDGSASTTMNTLNEVLRIQSDGGNWSILNRRTRTHPVAYTPVFSGWTTISNVKMYSYRDGNNLVIFGSFTGNGPGGATAAISTGFNGTVNNTPMDTTIIPNTPNTIVGIWGTDNTATSGGMMWVRGTDTVTLFFGLGNPPGPNLGTISGSTTGGTGNHLTVNCTIPIAGWKE